MVFKLLEHPIIASAEKLALILSEVNDALANVDSGFIRLIALFQISDGVSLRVI